MWVTANIVAVFKGPLCTALAVKVPEQELAEPEATKFVQDVTDAMLHLLRGHVHRIMVTGALDKTVPYIASFVERVFTGALTSPEGKQVELVISGGAPGADTGAIDAAFKAGVKVEGCMPEGFERDPGAHEQLKWTGPKFAETYGLKALKKGGFASRDAVNLKHLLTGVSPVADDVVSPQ